MLPKLLWSPDKNFIESSNMFAFQKWLAEHNSLTFNNYQELWQWSVEEPSAFWESIWEYFKIISHSNYNEVLSNDEMPNSKWFKGATLNYSEHIFRHKSKDRSALIFQNETNCEKISWQHLESQVVAFQQYLKAKGIGKGDRVAAFLPNIPQAIIAFLAVNSLGAIWTCCSPDFGVETVVERFSQVDAKLLIAVDGYKYNGKPYSKTQEVVELQSQLKTVQQTVLISYLDTSSTLENTDRWLDIMSSYAEEKSMTFTAVPFDHPIWILYSSGTTGKPKAITHSHGGVLLEHLKYMSLHNDVKLGENFFWFTTTGWMMWNFLQASLLVGATPVLYDGSPGLNNLEVLWDLAEKLPIHHFGTSAPYLTACMKKGLNISSKYDMTKLRSIGSTGAPLPPEVFEWVYDAVSKNVWLCSMSGGTDVCTAFVGGNPYLNVYKGLIQSRALGCALYAYNDEGHHVSNSLGEMVIEKPMPSMPIYFWNDSKNERYINSYFSEYQGKWRHGDWIKIFDNGSLIIQGRSDATLNRNGIRIGTAEIYNVLEKITDIKDSLILNLEQPNGEDIMPLYIVLQDNVVLSDTLIKEIKTELKTQCSPRHVPDTIDQVPDIPYTLSGKKMEVPVKKIMMGMDVSKSMNRDAIRNPEAMDYFTNLAKKKP